MNMIDRRKFMRSIAGVGTIPTMLGTVPNVIDAETGDLTLSEIADWEFSETEGGVFLSTYAYNTEESIYTGDTEGNFYSINSNNGDLNWVFTDTDYPVWSSPVKYDSNIYFSTAIDLTNDHEGDVYAIDAGSGEEQWRYEEPSSTMPCTLVAGANNVYAVSREEHTLYAVDAATGEPSWSLGPNENGQNSTSSQDSQEYRVQGSPVFYDDTIFIQESSEGLAIDPASGEVLWSVEPDGPVGSPGSDIQPIVTEDTLYLNGLGALYAINRKSHQQEWSFGGISEQITVSPIVRDKYVYISDSKIDRENSFGYIRRINVDTTEEEWVTKVDGAIETMTIIENTLYLGTTFGSFHAIHTNSGEHQWKAESEEDYGPNLYLSQNIHNNMMFLATSGGELYAIPHQEQQQGATQQPSNSDGASETSGTATETAGIESSQNRGGSGEQIDQGIIFRRYSDVTDSIAVKTLLAGGGLTGAYVASKKILNDDESEPDSKNRDTTTAKDSFEPAFSESINTPELDIPSFEKLDIKATINKSGRYQLVESTIDGQDVWVLSLFTNNNETISTEHSEELNKRIETWSNIETHPLLLSVHSCAPNPQPWAVIQHGNYPALTDQLDSLSLQQKINIISQLCEAIHHVHRHGILYDHLTINSLLITDDTNIVLRGLIDQFDERNNRYAAPEEKTGEYTERSVVYRIGLITYELFTGGDIPDDIATTGFEPNKNSILNDMNHGPPNETENKLTNVLNRALSSIPEDRYETVLHFRDALQDTTQK